MDNIQSELIESEDSAEMSSVTISNRSNSITGEQAKYTRDKRGTVFKYKLNKTLQTYACYVKTVCTY